MSAQEPAAREMTGVELLLFGTKYFLIRLRRKFPYFIWWNDQIDICVTFSQDKLDPSDPMRSLFSGELYEVEKRLRSMGIGFDAGIGAGGRDWEWDWSLSGPISIRFRGAAKHPEKRKERARPKLIISN